MYKEPINPEIPKMEPNEKKEKEMKKIFMVYRENDLFKKYESRLIETLKSLGYKAEMKIFPRETDSVEIAKWMLENRTDIEGKIYLSDKTCSLYHLVKEDAKLKFIFDELHSELEKIYDECFVTRTKNVDLDGVFASTTYRTALKEVGKAKADELIPKIIQRVLEKNDIPQRVCIVSSQHILSHQPFQCDEGELSPSDLEKAIKKATEKIKSWLIEGGVPENKITIGYDATLDEVGNWIVFDRHEFTRQESQKPKKAIKLQLPLESFYQDAAEQNLISFSEEELNKQLKENLERFLPKKQEQEEV